MTSSRQGLFVQNEYFNREKKSSDETLFSIVPRGYITYRHMSDDDIFHFNINNIADYGLVSKEYPVFTTTLDLDSYLLVEILNSSLGFRKFCKQQKKGGTRTRLYYSALGEYKISLPILKEQEKLSKFLQTLDNRINKQYQLVDFLKSYKRGFIFSLFKLENKYQIPMELTSMESLLEEYRVRDTEGLRVCSVAVEKGVIDQVEHLGRSFAAADTSKYGRVEPNYVIYTKSPTGSFPYGIVKQNKLDETVAVSPLYGVYKPRTIEDGALLHYYFEQHENANNYIRPLAQKGAKNTINITTDKFLDSNIIFPKKPADVQKIVCLLDILERNILTQNTLLDKFEVERKTLLSKLFI